MAHLPATTKDSRMDAASIKQAVKEAVKEEFADRLEALEQRLTAVEQALGADGEMDEQAAKALKTVLTKGREALSGRQSLDDSDEREAATKDASLTKRDAHGRRIRS